MMDLRNLATGYALFHFQPIYLIYLLCALSRFRYYCIADSRDVTVKAMTKLKAKGAWSPMQRYTQGKLTIAGIFCVSKRAIGWVDVRFEDQTVIYIVTTPEFFDFLVETDYPVFSNPTKEPLKVRTKASPLEVLMRHGCYKNFYYFSLKIDIAHIEPLGKQSEVVQEIVTFYRQCNRCTCFISGVPNAGKSVTGYLVAKELGAKYCHSFNPLEPGDKLSTVISDASPSSDTPLVIVLEEADKMIEAVHQEKGRFNRDVPTMVHNKSTWCSFLDDMIFFNHVILIMTSNSSKEKLDSLEGATYLRQGRVHLSFDMPIPIN